MLWLWASTSPRLRACGRASVPTPHRWMHIQKHRHAHTDRPRHQDKEYACPGAFVCAFICWCTYKRRTQTEQDKDTHGKRDPSERSSLHAAHWWRHSKVKFVNDEHLHAATVCVCTCTQNAHTGAHAYADSHVCYTHTLYMHMHIGIYAYMHSSITHVSTYFIFLCIFGSNVTVRAQRFLGEEKNYTSWGWGDALSTDFGLKKKTYTNWGWGDALSTDFGLLACV
jgi:hypothetical protein